MPHNIQVMELQILKNIRYAIATKTLYILDYDFSQGEIEIVFSVPDIDRVFRHFISYREMVGYISNKLIEGFRIEDNEIYIELEYPHNYGQTVEYVPATCLLTDWLPDSDKDEIINICLLSQVENAILRYDKLRDWSFTYQGFTLLNFLEKRINIEQYRGVGKTWFYNMRRYIGGSSNGFDLALPAELTEFAKRIREINFIQKQSADDVLVSV